MNNRELYHHGIKGMHWGQRRFQNQDGSLTPAGKDRYGVGDAKQRMKDAKAAYKAANKEYSKAYDKAYSTSARYPISQYTNKKRKEETNRLWLDAMNKAEAANKAKDAYKAEKKAYKNSDEYKAKRNKALKVAAGVAAAGLAAYGTYKVAKLVQDKRFANATNKANQYLKQNFRTISDYTIRSDGSIQGLKLSTGFATPDVYNYYTARINELGGKVHPGLRQNEFGKKAMKNLGKYNASVVSESRKIFNEGTGTKLDKSLNTIVKTGDAVTNTVTKTAAKTGNALSNAGKKVYNNTAKTVKKVSNKVADIVDPVYAYSTPDGKPLRFVADKKKAIKTKIPRK